MLNLYARTGGRISRTTWWLGFVPLVAVYLIGQKLLLSAVFSVEWLQGPMEGDNPLGLTAPTELAFRLHALANAILLGALSFAGYCLSVKRRHDRNSRGVDVAFLFAIAGALGLARFVALFLPRFGSGPAPVDVIGSAIIFGGLYQIFAVYALIVLGLLRGTDGANDYGLKPAR